MLNVGMRGLLRRSMGIVAALATGAAVSLAGAPTASAATEQAWYLTNWFGGTGDTICSYGAPGDIAVSGDWNGDGIDTPGVFRNGTWYLSNSCGGTGNYIVAFGQAGDVPVVGDWNGDGIDTPGVFRGSRWYLSNGWGGYSDYVFDYGIPTDTPVVGDWNGDGRDSVGIYRGSAWHFSNALGGGVDYIFNYGDPADRPVIGDWNGDGVDTIGIRRGDGWWLSNSLGGYGDYVFTYGIPSDQSVIGDWDGNGSDTPGISRLQTYNNLDYISNDVDSGLKLLQQMPYSVMTSQSSMDAWLSSQGVDTNPRVSWSCVGAVTVALFSNALAISKLTKLKKAIEVLGGVRDTMSAIRLAYGVLRSRGYSRLSAIRGAVTSTFTGSTVLKDGAEAALYLFSLSSVQEKCF